MKYTVKNMAEHKGAVKKMRFGSRMSAVIGDGALSGLMLAAIDAKQLVLGVYTDKELTACLIFSCEEKRLDLKEAYEAEPADAEAVKLALSEYLLSNELDGAVFRGMTLKRVETGSRAAKAVIPLEIIALTLLYGACFKNFALGIGMGMCMGVPLGMLIRRNLAWKVETVKEGSGDAAA